MAGQAQVYIIHGYTASPQSHWFPWLKQQLEQDGTAVHVPTMPDAEEPDVQRWLAHLQTLVPAPDENCYFVGHSLGCITLLRYLSAFSPLRKIGGLVLVSGFTQPLPALPLLSPFTAEAPGLDNIRHMAPQRAVVFSDNDAIVPPDLTADLAVALDVTPDIIEGGGHFLGSEGFLQLPVVYRHLHQFIQAQSNT